MCSVEEEIEALSAVYCEENEFTAAQFHLDIQGFGLNLPSSCEGIRIIFRCTITESYPASVPAVEVQSPPLTRTQMTLLQSELLQYITNKNLFGNPLLDVLVSWVRDYLDKIAMGMNLEDDTTNHRRVTILYQLDHMRSKMKYSKALCSWARQLGVSGRVLFCKRLIFVILYGYESNLSKFMLQQRSQNVDVNAGGRPCKERMLKVLDQAYDLPCNLNDFKCIDIATKTDMAVAFERWNIKTLFDQHVRPFFLNAH